MSRAERCTGWLGCSKGGRATMLEESVTPKISEVGDESEVDTPSALE